MSIDGGRLSAHKHRIADLRRRKSDKNTKTKTYRAKNMGKIDVDEVPSEIVDQLKTEIQQKAKRSRRRDLAWLIISMIVAIIILFLFANKFS